MLLGVFDGHGPQGHLVSQFVARHLGARLFSDTRVDIAAADAVADVLAELEAEAIRGTSEQGSRYRPHCHCPTRTVTPPVAHPASRWVAAGLWQMLTSTRTSAAAPPSSCLCMQTRAMSCTWVTHEPCLHHTLATAALLCVSVARVAPSFGALLLPYMLMLCVPTGHGTD